MNITIPHKEREAVKSQFTQADKPGQLFTYIATETSLSLGNDVQIGTENRDWQTEIARGVSASTSYTRKGFVDVVLPFLSGNSRWTSPLNRIDCFGTAVHMGNGYSLIYIGDDAATRDLALTRLKRKLQSHSGRKDLIVPIAELRDLRRTIVGTAKLTTKAVQDLVRIRKKRNKVRDAYKWASDAWLTFNFGVKPLLNDIQDISASIQDYLNRSDHTARLTGTAEKIWTSSITQKAQTGLYGCPIRTDSFAKHTLSYRYTGGFDFQVDSANNYGLGDHFGLGLGELVPASWELVPYSWIMDYFGTVGAYLDDTFSVPAGDLKYLVLNRRYTMETSVRGHYYENPPNSTKLVRGTFRHGGYKYFSFSRTPLTTLPRIGLRFRSFDEVGQHAVTKLLNLTALLKPSKSGLKRGSRGYGG